MADIDIHTYRDTAPDQSESHLTVTVLVNGQPVEISETFKPTDSHVEDMERMSSMLRRLADRLI